MRNSVKLLWAVAGVTLLLWVIFSCHTAATNITIINIAKVIVLGISSSSLFHAARESTIDSKDE